jgi:hypothetical protein
MKGLDDVTGEEPSTCKATSQPEYSRVRHRESPPTRLIMAEELSHIISAYSPFPRRPAPQCSRSVAIVCINPSGGGTEGWNPASSSREFDAKPDSGPEIHRTSRNDGG